MNDLKTKWHAAWQAMGLELGNPELLAELLTRYAEPHRHYHTGQHLDECFSQFALIQDLAERPGEVAIALWFHDAVYAVKRQDNEERSADWARSALIAAGCDPAAAERVYQLIMATRHSVEPATLDEQILVDVDLSILGADAVRFDQYEQQIRAEYDWVPGFFFRRKRRAVLEVFLGRQRIFNTERFFDLYEAQARVNLLRSLNKLRGLN